MNKASRFTLLFLSVLLLSSVACNFSLELPWNIGPDDVEISPEDIAVAATRAAEAAAAAVVAADQAGQLAATAITQGDGAAATAAAQNSDGSDAGQALEAGAEPPEIYHSIILLASTIGFPAAAAAMSWAREIVEPLKGTGSF